jgi:signal transduction histidine kinase
MKDKEKKGETEPGRKVEGLDQPFPNGPRTETELHKALDEAKRRQKETLALLHAARAVMAHEHFADAAREIFDHCREVIGAPAGYIALLDESETDNELVFLEAGGLPCTVAPDLPMPIRGLRAEAYRTGEVIYENDFSHSDHVRFLPAGHVTLENVLFAPLKTPEQQTVGLLGLANKPGAFTAYDACLAAGFAEIAAIALVSKRVEEALRRELAVTAGLARLYEPLILPSSSILTISLSVLEQAQELTGSEHGYVSTIDPVNADNLCHTFTEMMKGPCRVTGPDRRIVFPRSPDGRYPLLWGHALNTRQAFFTNAPSTHPASSGVPPGHIPIHRFLSVPVMLGEELVGQIAVANPGRDYTPQDLEAVRRLSELYALAIQRKRFEEELAQARDHLDFKVKQRTAELEHLNVQLTKEIRERQKIEAELRQSEQRLRDLASQLLTAQEQERQRVSRELHDELGQSLMVLKLQIRHLEKNLASDQRFQDSCAGILQQLDEVIENVRRLSRDLSPTILEDLGLMVALRNLFDTFGKHYGIKDLTYHLDEIENLFPPEFQVNIYRIFQEALTNIGKHARASRVTLVAKRGAGEVFFSLEDNGVGFDLKQVLARDAREKGMGLAAMAERVRILGGALHIHSEVGQGTSISYLVPAAS